jgi:DNA-binding protein H-NS
VNVKEENLAAMTAEELWALHEKITAILSSKLDGEKNEIERRLAQLKGHSRNQPAKPRRRRYPKVLPKYQNPERPFETWSGRGKRPRWVVAQLRAGKNVDDLLMTRPH